MSGSLLNRPFKGAGVIMIKEKGANTGFREFGNASALTFAIGENKATQKDYRTPAGGNAASSSQITDVTGSITGLSYQADVLAIALRGLVSHNASTSIVEETIVLHDEEFIMTAGVIDTAESITISYTPDGGGADQTLTTAEYEVVGGMLKIKNVVTPDEGLSGKISYTTKASTRIKGLASTSLEYDLVFNGYNTADNDKECRVHVYRVKFSASQALDLINEDYGELPIEFECLSDDTKPSDDRFMRMDMVD